MGASHCSPEVTSDVLSLDGLICDDCDVLSLHLEDKFLICGNVLSSVCLLLYIPYWFIEIP